MRRSKQRTNRDALRLNAEQREILFGILLGDAHLETFNHGRTYRLKVEQSKRHAAYVAHLFDRFRPWVATPPKSKIRATLGRAASESHFFQTVSHAAFRFYAHQFYQTGKKCVPKLVHKWLTPRALAFWFMDDGSMKSSQSKGVLFNTQAFDKSDVERLANAMQTNFGLQCTLRRQSEGWQIYVSGDSFETLVELIEPFVIDEMRYKMPLARRTRMPKE